MWSTLWKNQATRLNQELPEEILSKDGCFCTLTSFTFIKPVLNQVVVNQTSPRKWNL